MPFQPGHKLSVGGRKDKPFRDALMMELKSAGQDMPALREIARGLINRAKDNDQAAREFADRIDGKVPQSVIGGDDDDNPIKVVQQLERIIIRPPKTDNQDG